MFEIALDLISQFATIVPGVLALILVLNLCSDMLWRG